MAAVRFLYFHQKCQIILLFITNPLYLYVALVSCTIFQCRRDVFFQSAKVLQTNRNKMTKLNVVFYLLFLLALLGRIFAWLAGTQSKEEFLLVLVQKNILKQEADLLTKPERIF